MTSHTWLGPGAASHEKQCEDGAAAGPHLPGRLKTPIQDCKMFCRERRAVYRLGGGGRVEVSGWRWGVQLAYAQRAFSEAVVLVTRLELCWQGAGWKMTLICVPQVPLHRGRALWTG